MIAELADYSPKHALPIYTKITPEGFNDYTVGDKYDMRIDDSDRQNEKGGEGPYNYVHECLLISKEVMEFGDVPDILIAFDGYSKSREEALERISPGDTPIENDRVIELLVFLRLDKAKEFIEEGHTPIEYPFRKEDVEGNGPSMATE